MGWYVAGAAISTPRLNDHYSAETGLLSTRWSYPIEYVHIDR
jgi:hypothetical protein